MQFFKKKEPDFENINLVSISCSLNYNVLQYFENLCKTKNEKTLVIINLNPYNVFHNLKYIHTKFSDIYENEIVKKRKNNIEIIFIDYF